MRDQKELESKEDKELEKKLMKSNKILMMHRKPSEKIVVQLETVIVNIKADTTVQNISNWSNGVVRIP